VPAGRATEIRRLLAGCRSATGRVELALGVVFILAAVFYVWTAGTSVPLSLNDGAQDRYNLLASALLHLHLSVGPAPAALLHLRNPYDPSLNNSILGGPTDASSLNDDVLYHGQLYFVWGAAPALVLLVPLHLLGFEPSASVTVAVFSVAGLGFALAALRVLIRHIGGLPTWICILAALAVSLGSTIPFILRTPSVTEDVLAGGYCFTMAGVWLAIAALSRGRASVSRLVLMSLCFGLAAGSRPTLGICGLVLIPVYMRLRRTRSRRPLALALGVPLALCAVLLLAYNQARFDQPLEVGSRYQLSGNDAREAPLGRLSYALPGTWFYLSTPPQAMIVFPFVALRPPKATSPKGLAAPEITGGLLPMTPIIAFVALLPWIWRRRRSVLGPLATPLMILAGAGLAMMLLASYEYYAPTERYEVDFATLFVLGALAAWLALCTGPPSARRRLLRIGGAVLVSWGCAAGLATSFFGYGDALETGHPHTWRTLEDLGAPLSTAIDVAIGHPVLAASFTSVSMGATEYVLLPAARGSVTVVSPGKRTATLLVKVERLARTRYRLGVSGPGATNTSYTLPNARQTVAVIVQLGRGLNHFELYPIAASAAESAIGRPVMGIKVLSLAPAGG
jgi:hypothetical protein